MTATGGTPQSTTAGTAFRVALQVTVKDTGGNPESGVTVNFAAPGSGAAATLSGNSAVTNSSGVASITATANATLGSYAVTATVGALTATFSLTNAAGPPATVVATAGTPQSTAVSTPFTTGLQVVVKDSNGDLLNGVTVSFSAPGSGASATLSSPTATTNAQGVASVTATANGTLGSYAVTATSQGISGSFNLTNIAGLPSSVTATGGTPQSAQINTAFATALQVTVKDAGGDLLSGVTVNFSAPGSNASATLSSSSAMTNAQGVASVTATANATTGSYLVTATVGSLNATFSLTNSAIPPPSIAVNGGTPQSATVGTAFITALQVLFKDNTGTPQSGVTITFTPPVSGAGATLSSPTAVTNAQGLASVTATANGTPGSYSVTAAAQGVSTAFNLTNIVGPPATLTATAGTPQSTLFSTAFATALQVVVKDASGNLLSGVNVTFTPAVSPATATLSSTTATTNVQGVASVTATANATPGAYLVTATLNALSATFSLINSAGPPASLVATGGTPQSAQISTAFPTPLQVTVKDAGGNLLSGITVNFSAPGSGAGATLSTGSAITNASGIASITATANATTGSYSVTASVNALNATFSLTNTAVPPPSITATTGTPQSVTVGAAFGTPLQVLFKDNAGNPQSGITITFTPPASGAGVTLSGTTAVTNAQGLASVTATANGLPGSYSVTAGAQGVSTMFSLTNIVGPPASVTAIAGTPQSAVVATAFATALQVVVKDASGNLLNGVTVTFTPPPSGAGATLSSPTATTNAQGLASVTATANTTLGSYSVTAGANALSAPFTLTNIAGPPATLIATGGTPQSATIGVGFAAPLQVTVKDSNGDLLSGVTVTFSAPGSGARATFSSTTAITNAGGVASVTATAGTVAGSYSVTAAAGALSATFSLTNTAGPPASVTATAGTPQSTKFSTAFVTALQATVTDAGGNLLSGVTVSFAAPGSGASAVLSSPTAVTTAQGVASVTATANATLGSYFVTASVGGINATFALTNNSGTPTSLVAVGGNPQSTVAGTPFATPLQVAVRDQNGALLSGVTVNFAAPGSGASAILSSLSAITNAQGIASVTATANTHEGTYGNTASTASLTAVFSLSNLQAPTPTISAIGGTPQSAAVGTQFGTALKVLYQDANGNPQSGVTIAFSAPVTGPSAILSSPTAVTDANGVASVTATANSISGQYGVTAFANGQTTGFSLTNTGPAITIGALLNAASLADKIAAANDIVAAFGNFPGCASATVTVDGVSTPVFYSSPTQVNFLLPAGVASETSANLLFGCAGLTSQVTPIPVASTSPGIFTAGERGTGQAAIVNQNGSLSTSTVAGTYIVVFGTGFGAFSPPSPDGLRRIASTVTASLVSNPGTPAATVFPVQVLYAGEAPTETTGLQQINLFIPANAPTGLQQLVLQAGTAQTQAGVTITVLAPRP